MLTGDILALRLQLTLWWNLRYVKGKVQWDAYHLRDPQGYELALDNTPKEVESVINHRVINRRHIVAGVSGGVVADARAVIAETGIESSSSSELENRRAESTVPAKLLPERWWWD